MVLELNDLPLFLAVAQERNFRAAGDRLGVTRSAVSQGVRRLEDRLGIALVSRTTRSVHLTEAGERLLAAVREPVSEIRDAFEVIGSEATPRGRLRIAVTSIAEAFLSGAFIADFCKAYPQVALDISVTDEEFDIVAAGFDAGIRLGEVVELDMIAVPLAGPQREAVAASPGYLASHGSPEHPRDLLKHRCIGWRPAPDVAPYRWEFEDESGAFDIEVDPYITTNDLRLLINTALHGAGVTFATEETLRPYFQSGVLVSLLEPFLPPFPGFYLYFPQRRNMAPKLRALVDHTRRMSAEAQRGATGVTAPGHPQ